MPSELNNPLLQNIEDGIEASLTDANRADFNKIVVAGMHHAMADDGAMLKQLANAPDPIVGAAKGAVGLVLIMRKETMRPGQTPMPEKAMVPAAMALLLKALDFVDRSKIAPVGNPEIERATHVWTDFLFARMGITKQGLANVAQRVHQITQDPKAIAAMNLKAGITQHPMAAKPTPLAPAPSGGGLINAPNAPASGG